MRWSILIIFIYIFTTFLILSCTSHNSSNGPNTSNDTGSSSTVVGNGSPVSSYRQSINQIISIGTSWVSETIKTLSLLPGNYALKLSFVPENAKTWNVNFTIKFTLSDNSNLIYNNLTATELTPIFLMNVSIPLVPQSVTVTVNSFTVTPSEGHVESEASVKFNSIDLYSTCIANLTNAYFGTIMRCTSKDNNNIWYYTTWLDWFWVGTLDYPQAGGVLFWSMKHGWLNTKIRNASAIVTDFYFWDGKFNNWLYTDPSWDIYGIYFSVQTEPSYFIWFDNNETPSNTVQRWFMKISDGSTILMPMNI